MTTKVLKPNLDETAPSITIKLQEWLDLKADIRSARATIAVLQKQLEEAHKQIAELLRTEGRKR